MIKIQIKNISQFSDIHRKTRQETHHRISRRKLKTTALKVFELEAVPQEKDYEISITLVDDKFIRKLNKKYRKVDSPTDVLAFPLDVELGVGAPHSAKHPTRCPKFLGDIYISLERASQQKQKNESLEIEVQRLLIHGLLHLFGYEHSKLMFTKQELYLTKCKN